LLLLISNFASIVTHIARVAIGQSDNITEISIPPEVEAIIDETFNAASSLKCPTVYASPMLFSRIARNN
jgi:hypothetical protein